MNIRYPRFAALVVALAMHAAHAGTAIADPFLAQCEEKIGPAPRRDGRGGTGRGLAYDCTRVSLCADPGEHRGDPQDRRRRSCHTGTVWAIDHKTRIVGLEQTREQRSCHKPQVHVTLALQPWSQRTSARS